MHNHYKLVVLKDGNDFFATLPWSLMYEEDAKAAFDIFKSKFPTSEGYEVRCTLWLATGQRVYF